MKDTLLSKLDLTRSHLKPYEGFIFLCGGPTDVKSIQPVSIRDAIFRELVTDPVTEPRIRIAEHYKDWAHDAIYRDLVSFERHLAALSSVIVLVLESPGSIAELGLFSVIEEFQSKLLVVIETDHYSSNSFIKLGPVDYLEKVHANSAECHRWTQLVGMTPVFDPVAAQAIQEDLADAVRARIDAPTPERILSTAGWLDGALLVCDLINFCSALTLREIRGLLDGLHFSRTEAQLRQILFLLERVRLIAMEPKGDQRFYVGIDGRQFVRFHLNDNTFDLARFRSDLLASYQANDKKRFRAIQEVRGRHA